MLLHNSYSMFQVRTRYRKNHVEYGFFENLIQSESPPATWTKRNIYHLRWDVEFIAWKLVKTAESWNHGAPCMELQPHGTVIKWKLSLVLSKFFLASKLANLFKTTSSQLYTIKPTHRFSNPNNAFSLVSECCRAFEFSRIALCA